jgi:hypothetical protein
MQPSELDDSKTSELDQAMDAIKKFVASTTERIDIQLDQHWAQSSAAPTARASQLLFSKVPALGHVLVRVILAHASLSSLHVVGADCTVAQYVVWMLSWVACMQANRRVAQARAAATPSHHVPAPTRSAAAAAAVASRRPQDLFVPPVNNSNTPFVPQLEHLEGIMEEVVAAGGSGNPPPRGHAKLERHAAQLNPSHRAYGCTAMYGICIHHACV